MKFDLEQSAYTPSSMDGQELAEVHTDVADVIFCGLTMRVFPGVYRMKTDAKLMAETVRIAAHETFLEVGCGAGAISVVLGKKARCGVATDLNPVAVENTRYNAAQHGVDNLTAHVSNVFETIQGSFDVIVCNPPYHDHPATNAVDTMYWDPANEMKRHFFRDVRRHLNPLGRIYFGWGNFSDIELYLPFHLAEANGLEVVDVARMPSERGPWMLYVLEIRLDAVGEVEPQPRAGRQG